MAILINIPNVEWKAISKGAEQGREDRVNHKKTPNPYSHSHKEHDHWTVGYLSGKNGWDIEY